MILYPHIWHTEAMFSKPRSNAILDRPEQCHFPGHPRDPTLLPTRVRTQRYPIPDQPPRVGSPGQGRALLYVNSRTRPPRRAGGHHPRPL